ncbi:MAG TPA: helix-turn-helix domain-containing protein [Pseudolabrys sp.]|nr:helix-turn-helix domain-containing protein [Pseudolabrys sp.]
MLSQTMVSRTASVHAKAAVVRQRPVASHVLTGQIEFMGATMPFARNAEIYGENEKAEYLYKVLSGSVRTYKILNDGRRQIGSFYMPGDLFGLEVGEMHAFSAEAVTDCKVLVIKRSALTSLAARDPEVSRQLWDMTARELQRAQGHIMLLIKTAQERVAGFLLEMSTRSTSANEIELPMSRQDIADYLGLTIETVSRTLTQLENTAAIAVPTSRRIVLRNRGALSRLNS